MSETDRAVDAVNEGRALEETTAHYATAQQQIQELDVADQKSRARIAAAQESIRSERASIQTRAEDRRRIARKRRVFANAKHQLQMIDEGL